MLSSLVLGFRAFAKRFSSRSPRDSINLKSCEPPTTAAPALGETFMKRMLSMSMLLLALASTVQAAPATPDQCFAQSKTLPAEQQEAFVKSCLGQTPAAPTTVSAEQRAKVCEQIAEREHFEGEQKSAFLKGCKAG